MIYFLVLREQNYFNRHFYWFNNNGDRVRVAVDSVDIIDLFYYLMSTFEVLLPWRVM